MKQEQFEIRMMAYLSGELDTKEATEFKDYLKTHPDHQEEFDAMSGIWGQMDEMEVPDPSPNMDTVFFDMLYAQQTPPKSAAGQDWLVKLKSVFATTTRPQWALGMLLLGLGLAAGYFMQVGNIKGTTTVNNTTETQEVREQLVLTLLEQSSANKRLQGVSEANKITEVDEKVIAALLQTLNNDSNVNVRLAAIESLTNYVDNPLVREGLVQSIVHQESPIVQVTLANLMVALQEKKSIEPFKTLMRTRELNESVKQKLETSIKSII